MAGKERENFCRSIFLIVDHAKDSLVDVLQLHLTKNSLSFEDFINLHCHDIYHLCFNLNCCHKCPQEYDLPCEPVLYESQLKLLLDRNYCIAKPGVKTDVLDITLLRCLLINFCGDVFLKGRSLQKNINMLHQMRNVYSHAKQGRITDDDYRIFKDKIELAILEIAKVCGNETGKKQILRDLAKRPLDETLCIQKQNTLLEWIARETRLEAKVTRIEAKVTRIEEKIDDLAEKIVEKADAKALSLDGDTKQKLTKDEEKEDLRNSDIEMKNQQDNLPMLSEKVLMYVASKLGNEWTQVAILLDIEQAEIEQIQRDNPYNSNRQITVALIRWRNRQYNRPQQDVIKQLIEALEFPERRDIIDNLREKYGIDMKRDLGQ